MSFEEFLLAKGESELEKLLSKRDFLVLNTLHERLINLLRQYFFAGGMHGSCQ